MDAKTCCNCKVEKPFSEFNKQSKTRDGLKTICKPCHKLLYYTLVGERNKANWVRPTEGVKRCPTCKLTLPVSKFSTDRKRSDGLQARCSQCNNFLRRTLRLRTKTEVLAHYAGGTAHCVCCQEWRIEFLQIDHIAGDGSAHKRSIGWYGKSSDAFYRWLKLNDYPSGFRTLCANCNTALGYFGYCPHQLEDKEANR